MQDYKRRKHGTQRGLGAQNVDVTQKMADVDDNSLKKDLETCKRFFVESEIENGRRSVYKFAVDTLDAKICWKSYMLYLAVSNVQLSWL